VPDAVIDDYRLMPEPFRHGLGWAKPLLNLPELRGAMAPAKWQRLALILKREKIALTGETAPNFLFALAAVEKLYAFTKPAEFLIGGNGGTPSTTLENSSAASGRQTRSGPPLR
jgi:hypothetical protein